MGKFTGKFIVSDFDGTVFSSRTGMSQRNIEAAQYFMGEGGLFTIATGRTHTTFGPHYEMIPTNAATILSNGASVFDFRENRSIIETNLPETVAEDLAELCRQMPQLAFEAYHDSEIYVFRPNDITNRHMEIVGSQYIEAEIEKMPRPWLKALVQEEHEILEEARDRLQKIRPEVYETIFSNPRYLEVTARGVNKGSAVLELAKSRGINPENIYCIGDNENDLPMLSISAKAFAPSSSAKVVLESDAHLLCPCEEGVLGDLVAWIEENTISVK